MGRPTTVSVRSSLRVYNNNNNNNNNAFISYRSTPRDMYTFNAT